jgi:Mg-chelatase subunit ChlD
MPRLLTQLAVTALIAAGVLSAASRAPAAITLTVPAEVSAGAEFEVRYGTPSDPKDFISIDKPGAADRDYGPYAYVKDGTAVTLRAPDLPGEYQVRYHRATGYDVLGAAPLRVNDVEATLDAPAEIDAGATFEVNFSGPNTKHDFVSIDRAGAADRDYGPYVYTARGGPVKLRAPDEAGAYQVRYHLGQSYRVIAARPVTVGGAGATLDAPPNAPAGSEVAVAWTGPDHPNDFISIDAAGAPARDYGEYAYTKDGSPVKLRVPDGAGEYAVRYHTGQTYAVLAERPLRADPVTATVAGPAAVEARAKFAVDWTGPDHPNDYIALAKPDDPGRETEVYANTKRGRPARLQAPGAAGTYELRYVTGQRNIVLARAAIAVTPGTAPGTLRVTSAAAQAAPFGAVELILDASGSMLQRLGGERRIDLAKAALVELAGTALPPGTPFALRVFGHREADACRTDLEIALTPLDRAAALAKIRGIEAKNLAKTPIADALLQVRSDLAGVKGTAIVVLVTDGEETCGGDPAAAIRTLRDAGFDVRVNIVGFAIDELALKEDFEAWAALGRGSYLDASDGAALARAMSAALRQPYRVTKDGAAVATGVVGGEPVELPPGTYQVELPSDPPRRLGEVTVASGEEATLAVE